MFRPSLYFAVKIRAELSYKESFNWFIFLYRSIHILSKPDVYFEALEVVFYFPFFCVIDYYLLGAYHYYLLMCSFKLFDFVTIKHARIEQAFF